MHACAMQENVYAQALDVLRSVACEYYSSTLPKIQTIDSKNNRSRKAKEAWVAKLGALSHEQRVKIVGVPCLHNKTVR
jgi:hypothetical protein